MVQPVSPNTRLVVTAQAAYVALVSNITAGVAHVQNIGHTGVLEVIVASSAPADATAGLQLQPGEGAQILNNAATAEVYVKSFDETTDVFAEYRPVDKQLVLNNLS